MGAGLASALGRRLRLSRDRVRLISPVGAAAGLAAAFNSPIAAVIFVIEEVIGKWSAGVLGAIVLSAVSSVITMRWFLGAEPLFRVPIYRLVHPAELLAYAVLGIVGGLAFLGFVKLVFWLRSRLKSLPPWTKYVLPAAAGLLIGIVGIWVPQVMGAGYEFMDQAMHDQFTWRMLALLGALKILTTSVSFVSGAPGGLFAPTMFIGAMMGGAVGGVEQILFPQFTGPIGAYALVGMGVLFAGILRAPMTSVFMVLEVSGHYSIILPVMISNTIAYLISRRYQPTPIFDLLARQEGLGLPSMEDMREEWPLLVEDAMRPRPFSALRSEDSIGASLRTVEGSEEDCFLVRQGDGAWRCVGKEFLRQQASEGHDHLPLRDIVSGPDLPSLHPDQPLDAALRLIGGWPLLPVVHRATHKLVGIISLSDILNAYRKAGGRAPEVEHTGGIIEGEPSPENPNQQT